MTAPRPRHDPWVWRVVRSHLRQGRSGFDDEGSASIASYAVAAGIFLLGSVYLLNFSMNPPGSTANLEQSDLKSVGDRVLQVLMGTPGFPAEWDETATGPDNLQRLGLLEEGTTIRIDPAKFEALARGKFLSPSSTNGYVDYAEARIALGLEGYDFHIRAQPVFRDTLFSNYGVEDMETFRIAYIGNYTGLVPSVESLTEAASLDALAIDFTNVLRTAAIGTGSVFPDDKTILKDALVPLLGNGIPQAVIAAGSGTKYDFARVASDVTEDVLTSEGDLTTALALAYDGALGYTKNREIRATLGVANFTAVAASTTIVWSEFVDTDALGAGTRDNGDYGFIEVSPDGGVTWYPITNDALQRSQDSPTAPFSGTAFAARVATVSATNCAPCMGASSVLIAMHWVADNDVNTGKGWIVDDVSATGTGFLRTFESPEFDLLVVGSNVDQNEMTPSEIKNAIADYTVEYGGRVVVLGGEQDTNWLQPIYHAAVRDGSSGVAAPDTTHPLLNTPNEIAYDTFETNDKVWEFNSDAEDAFNMVVGSVDGHVLTASKAGALSAEGQDGVVMLTTYLPYTMEDDQALRFLANVITYGRYYYLYLDVGPAVPDGDAVASVIRTATMDKTRDHSGSYTEMGFTLYVWRGDATASGASAITTPLQPTGPAAVAAPGQVTFNWSEPASSGTSIITAYNVYRGAGSSGSSYLATVGPSVRSYVDTAVTNGVTYFYNVTAVNSGGQGYSSSQVSATPAAPPSAPGTPSIVAAAGSNILSWSAPLNSGGSAITGYMLYGSRTAGSYPFILDVGNVLTYTHSGLNTSETWHYKLSAVNSIGESALSGQASGTTLSVPAAVVLTVTPGLDKLDLAWTAATGSPTGYHVYRGPTSASLTLLANLTSSTNVSFSDATVPGGTTYSYAIVPYNGVGNGTQSNVASGTALTLPGPVVLTVTPGLNKLDLSWTASTGSPTGFLVYHGTTSGSLSILANLTSGANVSFSDATVAGGATRYYKVVPYNAAGSATASNEASGTALSLPGAPTIVAATRAGGGITVTITAPVDLGGASAITSYKVYRGTTPAAQATLVATAAYTGNPQSYADTTAGPLGTRYYYHVDAVTSAGTSTSSNVANALAG